MKPIHKFTSLVACAAAALALSTPVLAAEKAAAKKEAAGKEAAATSAPEYTDEQKAALKALDNELARFDKMLEKDDDLQHKATVKAFLDAFKDRRDAMNKVPFDQGKYDEIRFDINVEYQRLAMWLADPITPPVPPKGQGIGDIPVYGLHPSPSNKADVTAALAAVDHEIARLEKTGNTRIQSIKTRRAELNKEFTKARWDALIADMRGDTQR
jgi:hypothetical protein